MGLAPSNDAGRTYCCGFHYRIEIIAREPSVPLRTTVLYSPVNTPTNFCRETCYPHCTGHLFGSIERDIVIKPGDLNLRGSV